MTSVAKPAAFAVRDYRPADFDRLCEMDRECFSAQLAYPPQTMREFLGAKRAFALVAEDSAGRVAGFVIAGFSGRTVGHVATLDVAPPFRRRSLGTLLLQSAESRLAAAGARKIRLESSKVNHDAHHLFEKLGYRRSGTIARYYSDDSDAWVLEKAIDRLP